MTLIIVLVITLVVGIIGLISFDKFHGGNLISGILTMIGGICLFIALTLMPINRYEVYADINALEAFKETVESARARDLEPLERAAILKDIASWNEWIARIQYNNRNAWDLWIPDDVASIQPLK